MTNNYISHNHSFQHIHQSASATYMLVQCTRTWDFPPMHICTAFTWTFCASEHIPAALQWRLCHTHPYEIQFIPCALCPALVKLSLSTVVMRRGLDKVTSRAIQSFYLTSQRGVLYTATTKSYHLNLLENRPPLRPDTCRDKSQVNTRVRRTSQPWMLTSSPS